jgi:hypothetical protein
MNVCWSGFRYRPQATRFSAHACMRMRAHIVRRIYVYNIKYINNDNMLASLRTGYMIRTCASTLLRTGRTRICLYKLGFNARACAAQHHLLSMLIYIYAIIYVIYM